jgi:hypothetical protein
LSVGDIDTRFFSNYNLCPSGGQKIATGKILTFTCASISNRNRVASVRSHFSRENASGVANGLFSIENLQLAAVGFRTAQEGLPQGVGFLAFSVAMADGVTGAAST